MKRRAVYLQASVLFCALFLAGCGYLGRGTVTASRLVTKADAERVLGVPARLEKDTTSDKESTCLYVDESGKDSMSLQVTIQTGESEEQTKAADDMARKYVSEKLGPVENVEGIGDAAWLEKKEGGQTLHVRKKRYGFLINALKGISREPSYDEMRRLAKRLADEL